ncbi:aspartic peptidase domain-containing protein, partial [Gorgonomyces haynaldii]
LIGPLPFAIQKNFTSKAKATVTGGFDSCFISTLTVSGIDFLVMLDTGSSDTVLPNLGLNDYNGPTLAATQGAKATLQGHYGDGSYWYGFENRLTTTFKNSGYSSSNAPIIAMTTQSVNPDFLSTGVNGLVGLAYGNLASVSSSPYTIFDAMVLSNPSMKNQVGFMGCPYFSTNSGWIDIGSDTTYTSCGANGPSAFAQSPTADFYTIDVKNFYVNSNAVQLPASFQSTRYSIIDSCTSLVIVPTAAYNALVTAIRASNGLPSSFGTTEKNNFLSNSYGYGVSVNSFNWAVLPTFTVETVSNQTSNGSPLSLKLTLGPKQYIQRDADGYFFFLISGSSTGNTFSILGLPFYSAFYILKDRPNRRIGFAPGCDCATATDGYPKV